MKTSEYFEGLKSGEIRDIPDDVCVSDMEKGHGKIGKREVRVVSDIKWLAGRENRKDLKTIVHPCRR